MIKIRVQLEELVGDMYSHVREVDITLNEVALRQIANALGWRNARGVLDNAQQSVQSTLLTDLKNNCVPVNGVHAPFCTGHESQSG